MDVLLPGEEMAIVQLVGKVPFPSTYARGRGRLHAKHSQGVTAVHPRIKGPLNILQYISFNYNTLVAIRID